MFSNLFFLILNLLLITTAIDQKSSPFFSDHPHTAFTLFIFSYLPFLFFIFRQSSSLQRSYFNSKEAVIRIVNIELLVFFSFFYFFLGAGRWLVAGFSHFGNTVSAIWSLFLYFTALFVCHYALERQKKGHQAWLSICFLLPFVIPFLLLAFFSEALSLGSYDNILVSLGIPKNSLWTIFFLFLFNLAIIITTLVLLPPLVVFIWQSPRLKNMGLIKELNELCERANFNHAGFKIWQIMSGSMTAAIIGITARFRYILFTPKLLDRIPNIAIVAMLAHEIGHSYYYHLFYYPFILLGMMIIGLLANLFIYSPILQQIMSGEYFVFWSPLLLFLLFVLTIGLYFRFVFGYFSRIFERQADLHIFILDIPAANMLEALNILAESAGNIHREPNWHHYSIQERIDCINQADQDRSLVTQHSKLVRISLLIYSICLAAASIALYSQTF